MPRVERTYAERNHLIKRTLDLIEAIQKLGGRASRIEAFRQMVPEEGRSAEYHFLEVANTMPAVASAVPGDELDDQLLKTDAILYFTKNDIEPVYVQVKRSFRGPHGIQNFKQSEPYKELRKQGVRLIAVSASPNKPVQEIIRETAKEINALEGRPVLDYTGSFLPSTLTSSSN